MAMMVAFATLLESLLSNSPERDFLTLIAMCLAILCSADLLMPAW